MGEPIKQLFCVNIIANCFMQVLLLIVLCKCYCQLFCASVIANCFCLFVIINYCASVVDCFVQVLLTICASVIVNCFCKCHCQLFVSFLLLSIIVQTSVANCFVPFVCV